MQAHFTHRDKIDDPSRDGLSFQTRILDKQTDREDELFDKMRCSKKQERLFLIFRDKKSFFTVW